MYGFAAERLNYQVRRVEIPMHNLPPALDGMKIVQISDVHLSSYMSRTQVRRAVDMATSSAPISPSSPATSSLAWVIRLPIASRKFAVCMHRSEHGL